MQNSNNILYFNKDFFTVISSKSMFLYTLTMLMIIQSLHVLKTVFSLSVCACFITLQKYFSPLKILFSSLLHCVLFAVDTFVVHTLNANQTQRTLLNANRASFLLMFPVPFDL